MIVKEARAARWAALFGLVVIALRVLSAATVDLKAQSLASLQYQFDANFALVASGGLSAGSAYLWATFFNDLTIYLLVGLGGVILGAGLIANETSSGSIFVLLSRPLSRTRALLTKYGVAAALSLVLCALCGGMALAVGAWQGIAAPPLGGSVLSIVLLWLGMQFVLGLTLLYSVVVPSALAAGVLGFFTTYVLVIAPLFHDGTEPHVTYFLGGPDWSLVTYWGSLGIYAGTESPLKSLLVAAIVAVIPALMALVLFVRKAY
jgi:ABC-type transport system involved in multi-copper enzyme maturation permease subunit